MALLSTFNPKLKQQELQFYIDRFGEDKVLEISRSFLFAIVKILLPALFFLLAIVGILRFTERIDQSGSVLTFVWLPLTIIIVALMVYRLWKLAIDYTMDFTIVTPEQIISYNQTFVLTRRVRTMQTAKIKTISIVKSGLLYSIFDNGDMSFLSEWDQSKGEINLTRIRDPEAVKRDVMHIVEIARVMANDSD